MLNASLAEIKEERQELLTSSRSHPVAVSTAAFDELKQRNEAVMAENGNLQSECESLKQGKMAEEQARKIAEAKISAMKKVMECMSRPSSR